MSETTKKVPATGKPKPPNAGKGRPKGVGNKTTTTLKEAILLAAQAVGEDGKGKGGLEGYLRAVAKAEPKAYTSLLGRVLPVEQRLSGPEGEALPAPTLAAPVINVTVRSDK